MELRKKVIVRKYAAAFLNLYFDALDEKMMKPLEDFCYFLKENRWALCYCSMPGVNQEKQIAFIIELCARFSLPPFFKKLVIVLSERHHTGLLLLVVQKIVKEFMLRTRVFTFRIATSHGLSDSAKEHIVEFLMREMNATKIHATFDVDGDLICGISIKSESVRLEHSIRRELKNFEGSLLQRVQE